MLGRLLWRLLGLERLRAEAPELFDGRLAREAVGGRDSGGGRAMIADYCPVCGHHTRDRENSCTECRPWEPEAGYRRPWNMAPWLREAIEADYARGDCDIAAD